MEPERLGHRLVQYHSGDVQQRQEQSPCSCPVWLTVPCLVAGLQSRAKTLLLSVSQKFLFGGKALHPGFPSSFVLVSVFSIRCSAQDQLPAPFTSVLCGTWDDVACGKQRAAAQAGFGGSARGAAQVVLQQLQSAEAALEEQLCECSWENNLWGLPLLPTVTLLQGLALEGDVPEGRGF